MYNFRHAFWGEGGGIVLPFLTTRYFRPFATKLLFRQFPRSNIYLLIFPRQRQPFIISHGRLSSSIFWKMWDKVVFPSWLQWQLGGFGAVAGRALTAGQMCPGSHPRQTLPLHLLFSPSCRRTKAFARRLENTGYSSEAGSTQQVSEDKMPL